MSYHLLAYTTTSGGAVTDSDMTAAVDGEFSQRNGHYIMTEDYQLLAAGLFGATVTRGNIRCPTWNAISLQNIWPVNQSLLPPANPLLDLRDFYPVQFPQNEEIEVRTTNGAAEVNSAFLWVSPRSWNANVPRGLWPITLRCTSSITIVANAWSALAALTFEQSPKGGVYSVCGMSVQAGDTQVTRLNFPRAKQYNGRKLLPGVLVNTSIGQAPNVAKNRNPCYLGEMGRFHTFEPPTVQSFGPTAGAETTEIRLHCIYLGESESLLAA